MTDLLDTVSTFRARSDPPDLDALAARSPGADRPAGPPGRRRAVAALAVAAALLVVVAGLALARRAPSPAGPVATTTSAVDPAPVPSDPAVGLARRFAVTATPSTPISVDVDSPGPDVPRQGWVGGGSTDLELTNVTDDPVTVVQPDWDAEGQGLVQPFPCPPENRCRPELLGGDVLVPPGATVTLPIWFAPTAVGTWDLTFHLGWRVAGTGAYGAGVFTLRVEAVEAPIVDDDSFGTTMPR